MPKNTRREQRNLGIPEQAANNAETRPNSMQPLKIKRVEPIKGDWLSADPALRLKLLSSIFVERAGTEHLSALFNKIRSDRQALSEPTCVMIIGETGTGKTTFLKNYLELNQKSRQNGSLVQPVLFTELQSSTTVLGYAKALAIALEDPSRGAGNLTDVTYRIIDQIERQQVEIVLNDEFNHVTETGAKRLNKAADWIKQVCKATNTPFVMAGIHTTKDIIDSNSQLAGITPYRFELGAFKFETKADRDVFRKFLFDLDHSLPFDNVARLADSDIAQKLFNATLGKMRPLMRLIKQASINAIERKTPQIGLQDLAFGYEQIFGESKNGNPFDAFEQWCQNRTEPSSCSSRPERTKEASNLLGPRIWREPIQFCPKIGCSPWS